MRAGDDKPGIKFQGLYACPFDQDNQNEQNWKCGGQPNVSDNLSSGQPVGNTFFSFLCHTLLSMHMVYLRNDKMVYVSLFDTRKAPYIARNCFPSTETEKSFLTS